MYFLFFYLKRKLIKFYLKVSLVNILIMRVSRSEYSDSDDESSSSSDSEIETKPTKNTVKEINIENSDDDDSVDDDSSLVDQVESDDDDDDNILHIGGNDSDIEEGEIQESDDEESENEKDEFDVENEDDEQNEKKSSAKSSKLQKPKKKLPMIIDDDDDEDDDLDENYLQKFDSEITKNYITDFHPECFNHNYEEISKLSIIVRNSDNIIIDPLHKTIPFLTKYEKARILGQRAKQIEIGAKPLISVPENIIDGYIIAELELREKKIPFIIKRPIPGGAFEYWHLKDLENIDF
jgi:DNA-directed RNA polymerase I, II, and III subunit RPABC2